jgi:hypothetical protein
LFVVGEDRQADLVDEVPLLLDEALVDEVQVFEGHEAGEDGEHPGQADHVEVHPDLFEHGVQVVQVGLQVVFYLGNVLVALHEV